MPDFRFKRFSLTDGRTAMKIGADSVLLGSWMDVGGASSLLDVGCGCGILSLMAAQRLGDAGRSGFAIDAIDIDAGAVADSAQNFAGSPWAANLSVRQISLQDYAPDTRYDHIFSNPPYYDDSLPSGCTARDAARCTATMPRSDLLKAARRLLTPGGSLSVILPASQGRKFILEAVCDGWFLRRECFVKTAETLPPRRLMLEFSTEAARGADVQTITVGSDDCRLLTEAFYL